MTTQTDAVFVPQFTPWALALCELAFDGEGWHGNQYWLARGCMPARFDRADCRVRSDAPLRDRVARIISASQGSVSEAEPVTIDYAAAWPVGQEYCAPIVGHFDLGVNPDYTAYVEHVTGAGRGEWVIATTSNRLSTRDKKTRDRRVLLLVEGDEMLGLVAPVRRDHSPESAQINDRGGDHA